MTASDVLMIALALALAITTLAERRVGFTVEYRYTLTPTHKHYQQAKEIVL